MSLFGWDLPPGCGTLPGEEDGAIEVKIDGVWYAWDESGDLFKYVEKVSMRYGTYTRKIAYGGFEYGFTFGVAANKEDAHTVGPCEIGDSEFNVVLGVAHSTEEIESSWMKYAWVAEAIMKASKLGDESSERDDGYTFIRNLEWNDNGGSAAAQIRAAI